MVAPVVAEFLFVVASLFDDLVLLLLHPIDELWAVANGLSALGHSVRRRVLALMAEQPVLNRSEIADALASDRALTRLNEDQLTVELHHNHLPKLEDDGYLEYEPRSGDAVLRADPDELRDNLESR